jgi:hypothetical protein
MSEPRIAKLVCFGNGGDSVEFGGGCSSSGYGNPERPHAAEPDDDCIIPNGTPAIDKRPAIQTDEGYRWVFKGPMCNVDLPDGDYEPCPEPSPIFTSAMIQPGNGFGPLLAEHIVSRRSGAKRSGLDRVSISEYIAGWRAVGARIGHYQDGKIVWDS